ncbi:hypothetical protein TNCV_1668531 [Trichonephila clavipes]|nr:hypothetical protein TNCV_1668531 [Trichonephila clavipes]
MLEKVIENWTSRLDYIRASRGSDMPDIIFKIYGLQANGRQHNGSLWHQLTRVNWIIWHQTEYSIFCHFSAALTFGHK